MKRKAPRTASLDDLLKSTHGVWVEAAEGFDVKAVYASAKRRRRVVIPLPVSAAKALAARDGETLIATVKRGTLVLERRPRRPSKSSPRA